MATEKDEPEESADRVVGRNLRELRLARELTVEQVAEEVGVSEFVLGGVERGTQKAYPALIVSAARFFGVSAARLFDGPTSPLPPPPSGDADAYALAERVLASRPETRDVLLKFIEENADVPGGGRPTADPSAGAGRRPSKARRAEPASPAAPESAPPPGAPPVGQDVDRAIGANIRRLREAAGLSQKQLGEMLDSSHTRVMRLEAGKTRAPAPLLVELARLLKGSLSDLLRGLTVDDPAPRSTVAVEDGPTKDLAEQIVSLPEGFRRQIRILLDREPSGR